LLPAAADPLISDGKWATQSSISEWSRGATPEQDAGRALNNNISGTYGFHTLEEDAPWWKVDLGGLFAVSEIRLFNRITHVIFARRASRFDLLASRDGNSWTVIATKDDQTVFGGADGLPYRFQPAIPVLARWIKIQLKQRNFLHLNQVQVFGRPLTIAYEAAGDDRVRDWFALRSTYLTASEQQHPVLAEADKRQVRMYCRLTSRLVGQSETYWLMADCAVDGEPLRPEAWYVLKDHWSPWPPVSQWMATGAASVTLAPACGGHAPELEKRLVSEPDIVSGKIVAEDDESWTVVGGAINGARLEPGLWFVPKAGLSLRALPPALPAPQALGYFFNHGGLTNQKLALLGLFLRAFETGKPLVLPAMSIKDIAANTEIPIPFADVFDITWLSAFAAKHGVKVLTDDPAQYPIGGWDYFVHGSWRRAHHAIHAEEVNADTQLVRDFAISLVPKSKIQKLLGRLRQEIFGRHGVNVAVQLRVESDWVKHVSRQPKDREPEDVLLPFDAIIGKVAMSLPRERNVLAICDEAAVSVTKPEMKRVCEARFGIKLFFKSDFLSSAEAATLNSLELAIIDFELAAAATHFVGLTRSTFSNQVTYQKFAMTGRTVTTDYIYNLTGPELGLRTDNGGSTSARGAVRQTP